MTASTVRDVVLLGSTGSIGRQALDVISAAPDRFRVRALSAGGSDVDLLARQAVESRAEVVGIADATHAESLRAALPAPPAGPRRHRSWPDPTPRRTWPRWHPAAASWS